MTENQNEPDKSEEGEVQEEPAQEESKGPKVLTPKETQEEPAQVPPPGEPEIVPMHKEKNLSQEQMITLITNNSQALQNLSSAMGEGFRKVQHQDIGRVADLDKRLDNLEASVVKLVEFIKAGGQPVQQPMPGQQPFPVQPQISSGDPLSDALGPILGPAVGGALTPKNPYATIGEAIVNQQIKLLADPGGDPVRQIGQAVVDEITNKGIKNILNPTGTTYDDAYLKAKATADAKRDAAAKPSE